MRCGSWPQALSLVLFYLSDSGDIGMWWQKWNYDLVFVWKFISSADYSHSDVDDFDLLISLFRFPMHLQRSMAGGYHEHNWGRKGKKIFVENEDLNENSADNSISLILRIIFYC